ncbi:acetyl-CoA carboxylase carboxyl transferase subunit alpha [bacterium]|nr:MAG: acetyl-CoA carboxylase carboxyl transferase subunit alpha [bacterium]RKZ17959.1 MAG: acetyl-CoA carboxylase carboxyl transferase subunit alpha [bacterium]
MGDPKRATVTLDFEKPLVELEEKILALQQSASENDVDVRDEVERLRKQVEKRSKEIFGSLDPWQRVQLARHPRRPTMLDYVERIFDDFKELHGDRAYRDDPSIVGGMARIGEQRVMVVGHQKGRDTKSNIRRNFGMPHPEGYRKALRLMELAAKFGRPIVTFVDTPGAFPGVGAEERGQAEAIARNLREMARMRVPIIVFVTGEGGSGGALAIAVGDRVYMLENSIYSVISPEGCAAILWKDQTKAAEAAAAMKITADDVSQLGVVDEVLPEPLGGAHRDPDAAAQTVREVMLAALAELEHVDPERRVDDRLQKFLNMGVYEQL